MILMAKMIQVLINGQATNIKAEYDNLRGTTASAKEIAEAVAKALGYDVKVVGLGDKIDIQTSIKANPVAPSPTPAPVKNGKKVYLDAGHGGKDSGATGFGIYEKDVNLKLALKVGERLTQKGFEVLQTRTDDSTHSLDDRTDKANRLGADLLVSIHNNAGGGAGYEDFTWNGGASKGSINAQSTIHTEVANIIAKYGLKNRGKKTANFHMLRESNMPAILLEVLFMDNQNDNNLLKNDAFLNEIADAVVRGICRHFGV